MLSRAGSTQLLFLIVEIVETSDGPVKFFLKNIRPNSISDFGDRHVWPTALPVRRQ
jgi:hypothetical protein